MLYPPTSPYFRTKIVNKTFLDVMTNRPIPADPTDVYWEISATYNLRPDMLAYDLYNDARLWWVFAQRNPNKLKDPLFDFTTGVKIYIPKLSVLQNALNF